MDGPPDLTVWIVGPAREGTPPAKPPPPPRPPPPQKSTPQPEAAEALAVHPPTDLCAWGNSAGWMPAESPVVRELPRLLEIGARIQFGGWSALQETALGALNALNPLYHLAKSAVDTFAAADRGDWEAVGQGGVKTGVAAVGAAGAVAGVVRGAVAGAEAAASGAAGTVARVEELKAAIAPAQQGRVTMAVGLAEDALGVRKILIGTSEPMAYIRRGVRINPQETVVSGTGHAEQNVVSHAQAQGLRLIEVGATRPICPTCSNMIESVGARTVTPRKNP